MAPGELFNWWKTDAMIRSCARGSRFHAAPFRRSWQGNRRVGTYAIDRLVSIDVWVP